MKLNITPGPWYIDGKHIVGDKTNFEYPNDTTSIADFSLDTEYIVPDENTQNNNATAIVAAVNNTYHRGINPEAVPEILEFISAIARHPKNDTIPDFLIDGAKKLTPKATL